MCLNLKTFAKVFSLSKAQSTPLRSLAWLRELFIPQCGISTPRYALLASFVAIHIALGNSSANTLFLTLNGSIGKFLLAVLDGNRAVIAQTVERIHGKDEVPSSILGNGSITIRISDFKFRI